MQMACNQPKTFQNGKIFQELNNVLSVELPWKLMTDTCLNLYIASWITTHLVSNSCKHTIAVFTDTANNQGPSRKSGTW